MNRHLKQGSLNGFKRDTQETYSEPDKQEDEDVDDDDEGNMDGSEVYSDNDGYLDEGEEEEDEYYNSNNKNNQGYQKAHERLGDILDSDDKEESQSDEDN